MQSAGGHLKEIQRAMKNPMANLGMIFEFGNRRIRRSVGLDAPDLSEFVHSEFQQEAQQLSKNIIAFSSAVEHLLIKYTRDIIHEQILLNRLSNAAIDIYTMLVVLSRVTRALNKNISSADIEKNMTRVICAEVSKSNDLLTLYSNIFFTLQANLRIDRNLRSLRSSDALRNDEGYRTIAKDVLINNGIVHSHPLD